MTQSVSSQEKPPFLRTPIEVTVWLLAIVWFATNSVLAWFTPLTPDEAHYALYGLKLDWSYFDHPPMVGWLQALALKLGEFEYVLRLWPQLLMLGTICWVCQWTHAVFGRSSMVAVLGLWVLSPILKLLGFALVPEIPLLFCAWWTFVQTYKLTIVGSNRAVDWVLLGLALGLAALSKYTAITLAFSVLLALMQYRGFKILREPGLWVAGAFALICIAPILYWNAEHNWISFAYQLDHSAGRNQLDVSDGAKMQLVQLLAYTPGIYVLGFFALGWSLLRGQAEHKLLLIFAVPILLLFSLLAMKGRSLPHWTAVGVVFTLPLIAAMLTSGLSRFQKWGSALLVVISGLLMIVFYLVIFRAPLPYQNYQHPLADVTGWKEVAEQMQKIAEEANDSAEPLPLFIPNWSHASRIAWYARPLPVHVLDNRYDQFDLWYGDAPKGSAGIVLAYRDYSGWHREALSYFQKCQPKAQMSWSYQSVKIHEFEVYRCEGLQNRD